MIEIIDEVKCQKFIKAVPIKDEKEKPKKIKVPKLSYYRKKILSLTAENNILIKKLQLAEKKIFVLNRYHNKFCYLDKQVRRVENEIKKNSKTEGK